MLKISGLLFLLSGFATVLGIILAETFYPIPYSISQNMISNLGSTPPPGSIIYEPSARIFDFSLIAAGLVAATGAFLLIKEKRYKLVGYAVLIMGLGTAGVGLFPAFHISLHPISALLAFTAGGVAAIFAAKTTKSPFSLLSLIIGVSSLTILFTSLLFADLLVPIFGKGGTERLVAYPEILWLIGFGGYLLNS